MRAEDILHQAMALPPDERTRLAVLLMESVEAYEEGDFEEAWIDEITRRLDDHASGAEHAISAQAVFAEARERVKRVRG
jgi:putative addiction module component (TIGR02574 family)